MLVRIWRERLRRLHEKEKQGANDNGRAALNEVQKITLRDVFRQKGLTERKIDDIFLLLRFKPEKVRLAFYYVAIGETQQRAGELVGVSQQQIAYHIKKCCDIEEYLKS